MGEFADGYLEELSLDELTNLYTKYDNISHAYYRYDIVLHLYYLDVVDNISAEIKRRKSQNDSKKKVKKEY